MPRLPRRALPLVVGAGVAVAGCGGGGGEAAHGGLGDERHAAIERLYAAVPSSARPGGPDLAPLSAACERLDAGDDLLGALRRSCAFAVRIATLDAAYVACGDPADCRADARRITRTAARARRAVRRADAEVRRAGLEEACEEALLTGDAEREGLRLQQQGFALVATGERANAGRAQRLLDRLQRLDTSDDDAGRFRDGCA